MRTVTTLVDEAGWSPSWIEVGGFAFGEASFGRMLTRLREAGSGTADELEALAVRHRVVLRPTVRVRQWPREPGSLEAEQGRVRVRHCSSSK